MNSIDYRSYEGFPNDQVLAWIVEISKEVFGQGDAEELRDALRGRERLYTCIALQQGQPIGFKLGFMERPRYFESWRGGVLPAARRRGIADKLQRRQHAWCKDQGFHILTTTISNDNVPMLLLNLRHDYVIVGSFLDRGELVKIILQKKLDGAN